MTKRAQKKKTTPTKSKPTPYSSADTAGQARRTSKPSISGTRQEYNESYTRSDKMNLNYILQTENVTTGTGFQGYVVASFDHLVKLFGPPYIKTQDGKITNGWVVNVEGVICTIYDYKQDLNTGYPEEWHVGGKQSIAPRLIREIIMNDTMEQMR